MWKSEISEEARRVNLGRDFFKLPSDGQRLDIRSPAPEIGAAARTDGKVSGTRIKGGVMYRSPLSTTKHAVKLCLLTWTPSKSDNLEEREAELSKIATACHYFNYGHLSLKKMIYMENVIF